MQRSPSLRSADGMPIPRDPSVVALPAVSHAPLAPRERSGSKTNAPFSEGMGSRAASIPAAAVLAWMIPRLSSTSTMPKPKPSSTDPKVAASIFFKSNRLLIVTALRKCGPSNRRPLTSPSPIGPADFGAVEPTAPSIALSRAIMMIVASMSPRSRHALR